MNLLLESMTPVKIGNYSIRLWREELIPLVDRFQDFDKGDILRAVVQIERDDVTTPIGIARRLIALPRMNAVEVLDPEKHGIVLYRDWP